MSFRFSTPIYRRRQPISYESSYLQSPREQSSVLKDWQRIQQASTEADRMNDGVSQLYRTFSKVTRPQQAYSPLFPFAVYQFPLSLRNFNPTNSALRFKVRGGLLLQFTEGGVGAPVPGTDGSANPNSQVYISGTTQLPPDDSTLISSTWNEVVVPQDGNLYYFWLSQCLATETFTTGIVFGSTNTSGLSMQSGATVNDPWPTFPGNDPYHTLIASVSGTPEVGYTVQQMVRDHIPYYRNPPDASGHGMMPMFFRGDYSSSVYYFAGDVVRSGTIGSGNYLSNYLYWPLPSSSFPTSGGPIINKDPTVHTPDPWILISQGQQQ